MKINKLTMLLLAISFASCSKQLLKPPMQPDFSYEPLGNFRISPMALESEAIQESYTSLGIEKIAWRTVSANPQKILPGTVLFMPKAYGWIMPSGEIHDGYLLVDEADSALTKTQLQLFTGGQKKKKAPFLSQNAEIYHVQEPITGSVNKRFQTRKIKNKLKKLDELSAAEFDTLLQTQQKLMPKLNERIQYFSSRGRGVPYKIFLLGEGPNAKYDRDPLIDFARFDCMTFCEHVLAASISNSYKEMFDNLQRIRYRNGEMSYVARNHYTIGDWLPQNAWLLHDVTASVGGDQCKKMTKVIDRKKFFLSNGVAEEELTTVVPPETLTVDYIPAAALSSIKAHLQGGEIVSIVTTYPGIISAHMGIIVRDDYGNVLFRHASSSRASRAVVDEYLDDYARKLQETKTRIGMIFMRVNDTVKIPATVNSGQ
ncbi:MAG: DUF1460 domain-containing protein [Deferribacteres bacterium]|nr:DUF1460 domain-containing protein [candidate division KSB1 bacterium]MCB9503590.1 DUF1460 domain-containing protein [Deferribacteres bacterium]